MNNVNMRDILFIIFLFIIMYIIWQMLIAGIALVFRLFVPLVIALGVFMGYKWLKSSGRM